ncbi:xanthine dehydrogenase accessory factor [Sedimentibacter acidaminivorans]|uniref:Xanthine dehydrogenase accessory factor n=1 Tax=Sedimentibacter acidaminivorans TaxID=913099 RepID=A0ABS4GD90_9FIRM|nr:XdhC/CoxI family protein [Sedimentibacter acidaminivorans]MBP1925651.1 xanthine dehydrogenase accessory factor [Sedimentibacter acidaminivorans]
MDFYEILEKLDKNKKNIVITIVSGDNIGSKLILADGEIIYNTNNKVDWESVIKIIPQDEKSQLIKFGNDIIYIEFMRQNYNLVVCGAGHISISIIQMCKLLDLPVTVIDDRMLFANNARNAGADNVICDSFDNALDHIIGDKGTFFVIVTRGHRYDQTCLYKIIEKESAYVGMIGSRLRVAKVLDYLEEEGIPREKLDKVYTPIGLKIGAETPAEIAISIMAQIIEMKNKGALSGMYSDEVIDCILGGKYIDVPKAIITIVSRKGSTPRGVGTKMVVLKDGTMIGTIGGGCVEASIRQTALTCMDNNKSKLVKVDMTGQDAEDDGMVCGGVVEIFIEPIRRNK